MRALPNIFVIGDLCVDVVSTGISLGGITPTMRNTRVGGSAFHAANGFSAVGFPTIIFGRVGNDTEGDAIQSALKQCGFLRSYVDRSESNPTCVCHILFFKEVRDKRTIFYWHPNANEYDDVALARALKDASIAPGDIIYTSLHVFDQSGRDKEHCAQFFSLLRDSGARIIVDIVPHKIFENLSGSELNAMIGAPPFVLISEFRTAMNLIAPGENIADEPSLTDYRRIMDRLPSDFFVCRYGFENMAVECVVKGPADTASFIKTPTLTGYSDVSVDGKIGFGDRLTAQTLRSLINQVS